MNQIEKAHIIHRTFNPIDFRYFIKTLKRIYLDYGNLENLFCNSDNKKNMHLSIHNFKTIFFQNEFLLIQLIAPIKQVPLFRFQHS